MLKYKLGVIGSGNMAQAIINGVITSNILDKSDILVSDVDFVKLNDLALRGLNTTITNSEIIDNCDIIIIAVKPQTFRESLKRELTNTKNELFISIMAGVTLIELIATLGHDRVVRIMPNLPLMTGNGMSAICYANDECKYKNFVNNIFSSIGKTIEIDESKFDAVTAVSGSGPAYVFYFINSLIKGGIKAGLSEEEARQLAIQTTIGSSIMAGQTSIPIEQLINNVCSKGGTTIEAINHFISRDMKNTIIEGVIKCKNRSEELSKYEGS